MAQLESWNGLLVSPSKLVPQGKMLLWNKGAPVVCVPIGAPIEDAECDHMQLHPIDFDQFRDQFRANGQPPRG